MISQRAKSRKAITLQKAVKINLINRIIKAKATTSMMTTIPMLIQKMTTKKMILIIMMIIIIKNTAVLSYLMKATAIKILTVMRSAVLSSTTIQKLYGLAIR